jgi:hypothetical protein
MRLLSMSLSMSTAGGGDVYGDWEGGGARVGGEGVGGEGVGAGGYVEQLSTYNATGAGRNEGHSRRPLPAPLPSPLPPCPVHTNDLLVLWALKPVQECGAQGLVEVGPQACREGVCVKGGGRGGRVQET